MDCVSIISYWIDFALMVHQYPYCSLFKALAALRPLRLLCIFPGTAVILRSLETGWQLLLDVSGFIFFFMLLFALAGLITFQGVFSRRCYQLIPGNEPVLVQPAQYCSGYYNGTDVFGPYNPTLDEYGYAGYHGHLCSIGQICMEVSSNNPSYGFLNFDTIFSAFLAVYTFVSLEYWTDLMYQTQDADSTTAALYYCLGVYVIAFVLIFLIFAVITSAFAKARAESSHSAFIAKRKRRALLRTAEKLDDQEEPVWMYEDPLMDYPLGFNRLRFKRKIVALVKSREFFYFGGFLVFFDMVFMCIRSAYASEDILELIDNAETAFTFVFAIEILLRMIGTTTWIQFWSVGRNKFDLFLVIATCIIQLPMIQDSPSYKYLTIFQVARLYRLFICIPRVQRLLYAALGTGESFINVLIFLVLSTALCSPIFMQMFGGDFVDFIEPNATEMRFDTFWQSFLTLIVLYTSETWTDVLYNSMKSQPHAGAIYSAIFLCFYFAFGRYIMSGLYIAVILENFELEDEFIKDYQIKRFIRRRMIKTSDTAETIFSRIFGSLYDNKPDEKQVHVHKLPDNLTASITKASMIDILTDHSEKKKVPHVFISPPRRKVTKLFGSLMFPTEKEELKTKLRVNARLIDRLAEKDDDPVEDYELIVAEENRNAQMEDVNNAKSLFFFSPRSRIRYWCKIISGSSADGKSERRNIFNWFIMACVLLSIFMVILDEPSTRKMRDGILPQSTFHTIDITLDGIFIVEILIRVIADGLLLPPGAYLRNPWNQLDICVVILNVGTVFAGSEQTPRALSTVRSLRILRLIRYFSSVKDVFIDIVHAFPLMLDALLLTFLMLIPFSVYGVNIFGGRFWLCNDESVSGRSTCVGEYLHDISSDDDMSVNILVPRAWQNPEVNFYSYDTFGLSLLQLFTLTSTEGWVDSMFSSMSTPTEPDAQPRFDWNSAMIYHSIFYVIFMIVSHGTVQLFIGVIIEKFKQRNGIATLTTGQRQYADLQRQLAQMKPTTKSFRPKSKIRAWCYDLVAKKRGVFNRLMMAAVIINIAFRLGQGLDALQTLYHTVAMSMRSIVSVSAVFMLVMCLFAMMFMQYFGLTKYGVYGTEHSNFRDYGNALLLLVRMTTGEAWNAVMMDYAVQAPNCVHSDNYLETDCGSPGWAYFLFNFFYIICTHIFLNLFTAVIISNFEYAYETRSRFTLITKQDLRKFKYAWAEVDPKATGFIQKSDIAKFLRHLKGRFQLRIYDDIHSIRNLQKLSKTGAVTNHQRGSLNEKFSMTGSHPNTADFYYNFTEVNKCLSFMDSNELQKRRKLYNLTYMEILDAETPRGIAFADVLTIMTYRFLNIEESLTLEPLIERLGKVDQLSKQYATEKACGVFLTLIQRKHYLHQLWLKRNEDEINKLGVGNQSSLFPDGSPRRLYGPPTSPFLGTAARRKNQSPVPRIVIDDVSSDGDSNNEQAISPLSLTIPTSPFSNFSVDSPLGADSLSVMPGTTSLPSSPISEMGDNNSGGLSPNSPWAGLSPMTRQQWLLVDGNSNLSSDQANTLMSSLYTNMWSDMLEHEQTSTR
ncbi:Ion transport protein-domain-containing protein [Radiomyces spectabilis]|uniref:Ion transport protein-domain-containing protein n=1 Tax=Radiomyces spectabilis TaxID=64574 RepID=UPI002220891F|nr:Ion transport protein-domain-containing protein [Radiomyces spectabilis]KAI8381166.1 Ion transport protein-domain-containing protein [Radiomyces spectabilis]